MNKKITYIILLIILIVTCSIGISFKRNPENFVDTQSCISLSMDNALVANKMCNNIQGIDASGCINAIVNAVCPIDGVAKDALIIKIQEDNVEATKLDTTLENIKIV